MIDTKTQVLSVLDPQVITQAQQVLSDLWSHARYEEYYRTFRDLESAIERNRRTLESQYPLILQRYIALLDTARWHVLHRLSLNEFESLFYRSIQGIQECELEDVFEALRYALLLEPVRDERDILKGRLRDALSRSEVLIGQTKIKIADSLVEPTVKNWIKDWKIFLGDRDASSLLLVEYFNSSPNIFQLPKETIALVQKIFRLYAELLKSSLTPEGAEEKFAISNMHTGTLQMFDKGRLIDSNIPLANEELVDLRLAAGFDASGKPLPLSQLFHQTVEFQRYAKQVLTTKGLLNPSQKGIQSQKKNIIQNADIASDASLMKEVVSNEQDNLTKIPRFVPRTPVSTSKNERLTVPVPQPWQSIPRPATPKVSRVAQNTSVENQKTITTPAVQLPEFRVAPKAQDSTQSFVSADLSSKELAQYVLRETGALLPSIDLEKRLLSICTGYFDHRSSVEELLEQLTKLPEMGGVGLQTRDAQRVVVIAQRLTKSDFAIPPAKAPMPKPKIQAPSLESLQKAMDGHQHNSKNSASTPIVEDIFGNIDSLPVSRQPSRNSSVPLDTATMKRGPVSVQSTEMPILMGPLDELRAITIQEFRRLSADPNEAMKHIANQLAVLEEESMAQKAAGIEAWGASPLNQMYLRIGRESLDRMISIDDVIRAQMERKELTLTTHEFRSIADFNRTLRF